MSALDQQRLMMEQLMGLERDVSLSERTGRTRMFYDPNICKFHVAGLSPFGDMFKGTKSDFGPTKEVLDDNCQEQFAALSQEDKDKYGYERDLMDFLDQAVRDLDRKIERTKAELRSTQGVDVVELSGREEERKVMLAKIEELNSDAEKAGDAGEVEQAMALMEQAKEMKDQISAVDEEIRMRQGVNKIISVCEICGLKVEAASGAMTEARAAQKQHEHLGGKQYKGWLLIRAKLKELKAKNPPHATCRADPVTGKAIEDTHRPAARTTSSYSRSERSPRESDRRDKDKDKGRDRDRDRDRDRRRDSDRDRDRDRDRRGRDRSSDRSRRSNGSKSKRVRSRSRSNDDKKKKKKKKKKSHSGSKEKVEEKTEEKETTK